MSGSCPIAFRQIDANIARINAMSVSVLLLLFIITNQVAFLFLIGIDFITRLYFNKSYSLINNFSILIKKTFNIKTVMCDAGAKRVAAQFGLAFVFMSLLAYFFTNIFVVYVITTIFLSCAALELFFGYCVGCKVYFLVKRFF